ncbi:hypothetical protein C8Q74DRAFT_1279618 [Fomes fomentarius]|nr:hypothetical protein C8Q74DRAFT_1279618 [Fomes fomentarius]
MRFDIVIGQTFEPLRSPPVNHVGRRQQEKQELHQEQDRAPVPPVQFRHRVHAILISSVDALSIQSSKGKLCHGAPGPIGGSRGSFVTLRISQIAYRAVYNEDRLSKNIDMYNILCEIHLSRWVRRLTGLWAEISIVRRSRY